MANIEIERKFLVKGDFKSEAYSSDRIVQGYIVSNSQNRSVRVRIKANKGYITIKGSTGLSGMSRFEWEKEISLADAEDLIKLCDTGVIDKIRYYIKSDIHIFEVDEFHGENEGLVIAEVELGSENEIFTKPSWLGKEVTGDIRYYNSQLTTNPYIKWTSHD